MIFKRTISVRMTEPLVATIEHYARASNRSRNVWMEEAVHDLIERGKPLPCLLSAEHLLGRKMELVVRLLPLAVEALEELAASRGTTRQIMIVDACLTRIALLNQG